jgi:hypothetical protein
MSLASTVHNPTIQLLTPTSCDSDYTRDSDWKLIYLAPSPFIYMCSLAFTMVPSQLRLLLLGSLVHCCHGLPHWSCHLLLGFTSSHFWPQALQGTWPHLSVSWLWVLKLLCWLWHASFYQTVVDHPGNTASNSSPTAMHVCVATDMFHQDIA